MSFLPTSMAEIRQRGWQELDIILICGDAYVDHPSFGTAIIGRVLEAKGYRVGVIAQPNWRRISSFQILGRPRLFFGVSAGNMDSMVNHYTALKKIRHNDAYSPEGKAGLRPDRATLIYTNMLKRSYKGIPVILGGIEASLRRIAHYDYWQDKVRNSILADSKADILIYGMGEKTVLELADALRQGIPVHELTNLPGTVVFDREPRTHESIVLPAAETCSDKTIFHVMSRTFEEHYPGIPVFQQNGGRWLKHNPPSAPLDTGEMDRIYALPFEYRPHPQYLGKPIPAFEQIKSSITAHRGCYGGCNFCAIASHQGRAIQSRSGESIIKEASRMKGTISDVGGPTANMYATRCKMNYPVSCKRNSCLFPTICPNLIPAHETQIDLLARIRNLKEINHVYIASGIRHDLALMSKDYIRALALDYTGGRLKLAPEHSVPKVLRLMGKPDIGSFEEFSQLFFQVTKASGLKRQIIPYLIIGHPGTTMEDALELRDWLRKNNLHVEQVQEFTPTPMTISTCMYFTGRDFETGELIHVPSPGEVHKQKKLILDI